MSIRRIAQILCLLAVVCLPKTVVAVGDITIGTGSTAGVYYQLGRAVCRLVNAASADYGLSCEPLVSDGSIANLDALRSGAISLGVVQSDWQYHAYKGSDRFEQAGPHSELRALFSVHGEPFTVLVREDSGIQSFADLPGKRVNIGNPGSGQRATMEIVMAAFGWTKQTFSLANELPATQQALALCHDRVQAMIYTVGHPNASITQATSLCDAKIIDASGPVIDQLVADHPFYAYTEIPGGFYPGNPDTITTFGVKATLLSTTALDSDIIYAVVKTVFDQLDTLKSMHPAFATLEPSAMVKDGLSAPLHEGAVRYFKEQGLLQ